MNTIKINRLIPRSIVLAAVGLIIPTLGVAGDEAGKKEDALSAAWPGTGRAAAGAPAAAFAEVPRGVDQYHHVAPGYQARVLLRWGDGLFPDAPPFDARLDRAATRHAIEPPTFRAPLGRLLDLGP